MLDFDDRGCPAGLVLDFHVRFNVTDVIQVRARLVFRGVSEVSAEIQALFHPPAFMVVAGNEVGGYPGPRRVIIHYVLHLIVDAGTQNRRTVDSRNVAVNDIARV